MEKIELKAHKPKPNRMTSLEENVQLARIQHASNATATTTSAIYERKPNQKALKVLTVAAYILFVSMAAITLSFYYVFIWDPAATTPAKPAGVATAAAAQVAAGGRGGSSVICDTKIIIPENVAVRLANSTHVTAEKFYKYIYQSYQHRANAVGTAAPTVDGVHVRNTFAEQLPIDRDRFASPLAPSASPSPPPPPPPPRRSEGAVASRIAAEPLPLARLKQRLIAVSTTSTAAPSPASGVAAAAAAASIAPAASHPDELSWAYSDADTADARSPPRAKRPPPLAGDVDDDDADDADADVDSEDGDVDDGDDDEGDGFEASGGVKSVGDHGRPAVTRRRLRIGVEQSTTALEPMAGAGDKADNNLGNDDGVDE